MAKVQNIREVGSEILNEIDSKNEKVIDWKSWPDEYKFVSIILVRLMPGLMSCWP